MRNIVGLVRDVYEAIFVKLTYNDKTIASYFRKKGATIGENCLISTRSLGTEPFLVNIGDHVFIARRVILHTEDSGAWILNEDHPGLKIFGKIVIEDNCLIGLNSQIFPNVRIGHNSIVGAGSVVTSDVPPNSVVMGVPARVIGSSTRYKEKKAAMWKDTYPPGYENMNSRRKAEALKKHLMNIRKGSNGT
jgi:acetyltransferase-like isoleucine patch superfamily enzyme